MPLTDESRTDPFLGCCVGSYRIERKLGEGGMGSVYFARHRQLPNVVAAVKILRQVGGSGAVARELEDRFQQEAFVAAQVGNHRVVKPLDVGVLKGGIRFIIMEYVAGRSLADELKHRGPLPVAAALEIAARVADTMVIAHAAGIIHRDIKPQNIMLVREGERDNLVKLIDFGVARAPAALRRVRTAAASVIGTPGYLAAKCRSAHPSR